MNAKAQSVTSTKASKKSRYETINLKIDIITL
jgi:hypothetical protein